MRLGWAAGMPAAWRNGMGTSRRRPLTLRRANLRPHLTKREAEVLGLVATGKSNQAIGADLGISPETVKRHVSTILRKTGLHNRTELALYALHL